MDALTSWALPILGAPLPPEVIGGGSMIAIITVFVGLIKYFKVDVLDNFKSQLSSARQEIRELRAERDRKDEQHRLELERRDKEFRRYQVRCWSMEHILMQNGLPVPPEEGHNGRGD